MKALICVLLVALLNSNGAMAASTDPSLEALIDKLVKKGVISEDEANSLARKADKAEFHDGAGGELGAALTPQKGSSKPKIPFEIKIRAQARLDAGDLLLDSRGRYDTESDLFLRRVRLELDKEWANLPAGKSLALDLTLDADRTGQDFRNGRRRGSGNGVDLHYLYADWTFTDELSIELGKHKLPFLRAELTSSARQLLVERPASTGAAKDTFGDYHQPQIMLHGGIAGGTLRYYLSYADGASDLDALQDLDPQAESVRARGWGSAYSARVEVALLGLSGQGRLVEKKRDDTGIGAENHLTLGVDGGMQKGIRYTVAQGRAAKLDSSVLSVDLAGRYRFGAAGTLTGQLEYLTLTRDFDYRSEERPQGGYLQAGYLLPWSLLRGNLEPALRYEVFEHDRINNPGERGSTQRTLTVGLNHYLAKHSIKSSYNLSHTRFDAGVAESSFARIRNVHQLMLQLYF